MVMAAFRPGSRTVIHTHYRAPRETSPRETSFKLSSCRGIIGGGKALSYFRGRVLVWRLRALCRKPKSNLTVLVHFAAHLSKTQRSTRARSPSKQKRASGRFGTVTLNASNRR